MTIPLLKKKDKVIIISSARSITHGEIASAKTIFENWGLEVVLGGTIGAKDNQFAGSDDLRAVDLQTAIDDNEINAVFFARGGYGSVRILDKIDWNNQKKNPKWLIGYSDVTAVLMHSYYTCNTASVHGIMPVNITPFSENTPAMQSLKKILFEGKNTISADYSPYNRKGCVEGQIIGGNLSVLYSLTGSNSFQSTEEKILFIEDLDEYLYHIDRMLQGLKRAGKLQGLKALLVGQMTDMHDNKIPFGKDAYAIVNDIVKDYDFPVAFNIPCGHIGESNHAFIHGGNSVIEITDKGTIISQQI